jgi:hypothetical protein
VQVSTVAYLLGLVLFTLLGFNVAIVYRFWPEPWLTMKLIGASSLIGAYLLAVSYGDLSPWLLWVGLAAAALDAGALYTLSAQLQDARRGEGILVAYKRR